jgi:hypothetical protein
MQRPILAFTLAILIFGSVGAYARIASLVPSQRATGVSLPEAQGEFALELQFTCPLAADPFVLDAKTSLLVQFGQQELLHRQERVDTEQPLRIEAVKQLKSGKNILFLKAIPADEFLARSNAVRIRVLRNELPWAEHTLWSQPGEPFAGEIVLQVPEVLQEDAHE